MIPELGLYALILALCVALCQGTFPLIGACRSTFSLMNMARRAAYMQCVLVALAFCCLLYSFVTNDFSVAYVVANSNRHLPLVYRLCALWGAHEGSLLLWILILTLWMAAVAYFSKTLPLTFISRVLAVMAWIAVGFYLFLLLTSNPFLRLLPYPALHGVDLNPLLQDPGMIAHPPMLYMGYVGFSVAFAFAIAALLEGRLDASWAAWTRTWTMAAWCFLTAGIVLGSWWSYRELGWGGWWFWDPVENASFMPWLVGTALIHSLIIVQKRGLFKAWTVLLAVSAFSLSLLGTFLVRSGILISVHSFAQDPARGRYLLMFVAFVVGVSLLIYAWRGRYLLAKKPQALSLASREIALLCNNLFLFIAMLTILLGTMYPLIIAEMNLPKISVGYPYFNAVFLPVMLPMLLLMAISPLLSWGRLAVKSVLRPVYVLFILSALLAYFLPHWCGVPLYTKTTLGVFCAFFLMLHVLLLMALRLTRLPRFSWQGITAPMAMLCSHLGLAITVLGIALSSAYSQQALLSMRVGNTATLAGYHFKLADLSSIKGPNYKAIRARFIITQDGHHIAILHPALRLYNVRQIALSKTAIHADLFRDFYIALGSPIAKHAWSVRLYYKPFVRWIWYGGLMMIFGGLLSLLKRRLRHRRK